MSQSSTMRTLLKLRQPKNISLGASIGVHLLLLGVALPIFKLAPTAEIGDENSGDRSVVLVELNSVDVSRLPFHPSSVNLPPTSNPSLSPKNTPSVASFPETQNNNQQAIQSLFPNLPAIPLPTPVSIPQPPSISTFLSPPPPPPVIFNEPESVRIPTPVDATPSNSLKAPILAKKPKPSPPPVDISAEQQENLMVVARLRADLLKYDATNTSEEEATRNYFNWLVAVDAEETIDLSLTGTYPEDACMKQLEGTSVYGVKLSTDGKVTDAELIQSSGYLLLNQQALENINSGTWSNSVEQAKSYRISVNFKYDPAICPSLIVPQPSTVEALIETPEREEEKPTNTLENSATTPEREEEKPSNTPENSTATDELLKN